MPEENRRAVFAALVAAQDAGLSVPDSREKVAGEHGLTVAEVRQIERQGIESKWPPLDA